MSERCPDCGELLDYEDIYVLEKSAPIDRVYIRRCCEPAPTAAQLAAKADDEWLARQRRLAAPDTPGSSV